MDYTQLQNVAQRYADRQDQEITDLFPQYLLLAEARINRLLKTREQTARVYTPTIDHVAYYPLPPDYRGMRDVQITNLQPTTRQAPSTYPMKYISPAEYNEREDTHTSGEMFYSIIDNQIQILPVVGAGFSLEMVYYRKVPPLSVNNQSNWLSFEHPDIYVAAITGEISLFVKDYDAAESWFSRMSSAINELKVSDINERWTGSYLTTRIET